MPALPQLQGVVFRPFRGESDYPHFARIITAFATNQSRGSRVAVVDEDLVQLDERVVPGCDLAQALLVPGKERRADAAAPNARSTKQTCL